METLIKYFESDPLTFLDTTGTYLAIVVGVIVSVIIYNRQQSKKALTYYVVAAAPLLKVSKVIKTNVVVLYRGEPVECADIAFIRFSNTGNQTINPEDYIDPVKITFPQGTRVLTASIHSVYPSQVTVGVDWSDDSNEVVISNPLLNPGDRFTVQILADNPQATYWVTGRISGVREISLRLGVSLFPGITRREVSGLIIGYAIMLSPIIYDVVLKFGVPQIVSGIIVALGMVIAFPRFIRIIRSMSRHPLEFA